MDKTLKEHLAEARAKRWKNTTPEQRKAHSEKMNRARGANVPTSTGENP